MKTSNEKTAIMKILDNESLGSLSTKEQQDLLRELRRNYSAAEAFLDAALTKKEESDKMVAIARESVRSAIKLFEQVDSYITIQESL